MADQNANTLELAALRVRDRPAWRARVEASMRAAAGRVPDAARALGVSERALYRWLTYRELRHVPRVGAGVHRPRKERAA